MANIEVLDLEEGSGETGEITNLCLLGKVLNPKPLNVLPSQTSAIPLGKPGPLSLLFLGTTMFSSFVSKTQGTKLPLFVIALGQSTIAFWSFRISLMGWPFLIRSLLTTPFGCRSMVFP